MWRAAWLVGLVCVAGECAAQPLAEVPKSGPIPETRNSIGYPSPAAALEALRAKPGVSFSDQGGWTIAEERSSATLWSFTPVSHPAYPSAVKRQLVNEDGKVNLRMSISCSATKGVCDALVRDFETLNQQMIEAIRAGR
jgi:hypothetical protein